MRYAILPALASTVLMLSGCGGPAVNSGFESVHQPVVARTNYVLDLPSTMTSADRTRAAAWLKALEVDYGDRVSIDDPSGSAVNRSDIGSLINYYGLTLESDAPMTEGQVPAGMFRLVVARTRATVPGCPDWRQPAGLGFENAQHSNFGCGVNSTFAAMVADPNDLVTGKDKPPAGQNQFDARRARDNRGAK